MKPNQLYRGIVLTAQQIKEMNWDRMDLIVPYEPVINSAGRPTVKDGNEYGVYMTDNLSMVESAYGHPTGYCTPLPGASQLIVSGAWTAVGTPMVGVRYEIDSSELNVREPVISGAMQGHYNNGFEGKEWIADIVPKEAVRVASVEIGRDMLHDAQTIQVDGPGIKEQVEKILAEREARLKELFVALEILPTDKKIRLISSDMDIYRAAFGENGLTRLDLDKFQIKTAQDMMTYIQASICQRDMPGIDVGSVAAIKTLSNRLTERATPETAIELIRSELEKFKEKRELFEDQNRPTNGINRTISRCRDWLNIAEQGIQRGMEIDITELDGPDKAINLDEIAGPTMEVPEIDLDQHSITQIGEAANLAQEAAEHAQNIAEVGDHIQDIGENGPVIGE